jgi:Amidase
MENSDARKSPGSDVYLSQAVPQREVPKKFKTTAQCLRQASTLKSIDIDPRGVHRPHQRGAVMPRIWHAIVITAFAFIGVLVASNGAWSQSRSFELMEATIPQLQAALAAGTVTSGDLVTMYFARIDAYDKKGPALNAISVINANALAEADKLDAERRSGSLRGPLHGIPVTVKDNYDTADMQTADGSLALSGWVPPDDASLVRRLHDGEQS